MSALQARLSVWLGAAFGGRFLSPQDRALRALEEAVELAQAVGISQDIAEAMTDHVYARPPGDPRQELAGLLNTVLLTATALDLDALTEGDIELQRAWARMDEIRAKQPEKVML